MRCLGRPEWATMDWQARSATLSRDSSYDEHYLRAIDERLSGILCESETPTDLSKVFRRMRGAVPTIVKERLLARMSEDLVDTDRRASDISDAHIHMPELHPLDYEWYFTKATIDHLLDICGRTSTVVCLGVPSFAARRTQNTVLVDRNPLVVRRFPSLIRTAFLLLLDIADGEQYLPPADIVLFDAPWYVDQALAWLAVAMRAVKPNGLVMFPLFPPLVRPAASAERDAILEAAASGGKVEVIEEAIAYETPLFESEALRASGIAQCGDWRRADLVLVRKTSGHIAELTELRPGRCASDWLTYLIGSQVVKLRKTAAAVSRTEGLPIRSVPGTADFVYSSISARDPVRPLIDLWTSRNRVARVDHFESIVSVLTLLEIGNPLRKVLQVVYGGCATTDLRRIEQELRRLLE
jgi:hypothetical protein